MIEFQNYNPIFVYANENDNFLGNKNKTILNDTILCIFLNYNEKRSNLYTIILRRQNNDYVYKNNK